IDLRDKPDQLRGWSCPQGILKHRQSQFQARPEERELVCRTNSEVLHQNSLQFVEPDSAASQFLAVTILGQVRLAPEYRCAALNPLMKRNTFIAVERVMVNEDSERPLRR